MVKKTDMVDACGNILVDDSLKNLDDWSNDNGIPIFFDINNDGYIEILTAINSWNINWRLISLTKYSFKLSIFWLDRLKRTVTLLTSIITFSLFINFKLPKNTMEKGKSNQRFQIRKRGLDNLIHIVIFILA